MEAGDYHYLVFRDRVNQAIRETLDARATSVPAEQLILKRVLADCSNRPTKLGEKITAQPSTLRLIPIDGLIKLA
jgi:hypothetical protein